MSRCPNGSKTNVDFFALQHLQHLQQFSCSKELNSNYDKNYDQLYNLAVSRIMTFNLDFAAKAVRWSKIRKFPDTQKQPLITVKSEGSPGLFAKSF